MLASSKKETTKNDITEMLPRPFKKKRTFEEVADEIKKLVFRGLLKPGSKLPSEFELARQFTVGRQTIRESLRLLEMSGFITIRPGAMGGAVVADTIIETLTRSFLDTFEMGNIRAGEITAVRRAVEKAILSHVVDNGTEADIATLRENVLTARTKKEGLENVQFHNALARATRNQVFVTLMQLLMAVVANLTVRFPRSEEYSAQANRIHEEIVTAIADKRKDDALVLLEKDLLLLNERFEKLGC